MKQLQARRHCTAAVALTVCLATAVAGCGSSTSSSSRPNGSVATNPDANAASSSATAATLGSKDPASGTPVKLWFITDGQGPGFDTTAEIAPAKAAAGYLNDYSGGIGGRPVALSICQTGGTPAGATSCANQVIASKAPLAAVGGSSQNGLLAEALSKAGVDTIMTFSLTPQVFKLPGTFVLTDPLAPIVVPIELAKAAHIKNLGVITIDLPATTGPIEAIGGPAAKAAGIGYEVEPGPAGAADLSAQVQSLLSKGAGALEVFGVPSFCTTALQAIQTLAPSKPVYVIPQCFSSAPGAGLPNGARNLTLVTQSEPSQPITQDAVTRKDFALLDAVLNTYAPGATKGGEAVGAYQAISFVGLTLKDYKGPATAAGFRAAITSMRPVTLPLADGLKDQCNGKQSPVGPAACGTGGVVGALTQQGTVSKYTTLPTGP
jgi:branched-chain amino acid transport system substrate-binding protein